MKLSRLCLALTALVAALPAHAEIKWLTDLDEAQKVATKEKKAILVDFTGSDWCGWCIRLKKEVFDEKAFEVASKDFIFVELDFPRGKKLAPELKAKNDALAKKFNVQGFPTIMLLNAQGEAFAQTGYEEGGPANYLKSLAVFLKSNNAAGVKAFGQKAVAEAEQAKISEALDAAIGPFVEKKDQVGAEAALAKFIATQGLKGEAATRLEFSARMGITMECKAGDHAAILKLIDATMKKVDAKSELATELKGLRERVIAVRDQQAAPKK